MASSSDVITVKKFYGSSSSQRKQRKQNRNKDRLKSIESNIWKWKAPSEFQARLLGPTFCWETFYRQKEAFQYVDISNEDLCVFAYEKSKPDPGDTSGQRQYLVTSVPVFWHYYRQLQPGQRHHYEIIAHGLPCKLYFDLEFMVSDNPAADGPRMVDILIQYVNAFLTLAFGVTSDRSSVLDLDASTDTKFSRHLIFQTSIFEDNIQAGLFVKTIFDLLLRHVGDLASSDQSLKMSGENLVCKPDEEENPTANTRQTALLTFTPVKSTLHTPTHHTQTPDKTHTSSHCSPTHHTSTPRDSTLHTLTPCASTLQLNTEQDEICSSSSPNKSEQNLENTSNTFSLDDSFDTEISLLEDDFFHEQEVLGKSQDAGSLCLSADHLSSIPGVSAANIAQFLNSFSKEDLKSLLVKNKDGRLSFFCDLCVYTKNRNFRLYLSSKLNKKNPLELSAQNCFQPGNTQVSDEKIFLASLISQRNVDSATELLKFDVSGCSRTTHRNLSTAGRKPLSLKDCNLMEGAGCSINSKAGTGGSPFPEVDIFIHSLVSSGGGSIRRWTFFQDSGTLVYDITGYRWCANIGREHRSNNILYVADLKRGEYFQRCHDTECRGFRSVEKKLPTDCLPWIAMDEEEFDEDTQDKK